MVVFFSQVFKIIFTCVVDFGNRTQVFCLPAKRYTDKPIFRTEIFLKLGFVFKTINTFHSKTRLARRVLWGIYFRKKITRHLKIDIFWSMWVGEDNFKLSDILVGKLRATRGNTTKSSILKYYIICRIKMPKISKRANWVEGWEI